MLPENHTEITFDLTTNLDNYKEKVVMLKEGVGNKIKLEFTIIQSKLKHFFHAQKLASKSVYE